MFYLVKTCGQAVGGNDRETITGVTSFNTAGVLAEAQTINGTSRTTLLSALQNYQIENPQLVDRYSIIYVLSGWVANGYYAKFFWQE